MQNSVQDLSSADAGAEVARHRRENDAEERPVGAEAIVILVNVESGTVLSLGIDRLRAELQKATQGWERQPELCFLRGRHLDEELRRAFADETVSAVIVAGGDGSVSAAARLAVDTGKALGVLPCGTFNLFARSLGVGPDLASALAGMSSWRRDNVDVGRVNGETFLHHVSFGLHPRMIRARNAAGYTSRLGKIRVAIAAWIRTARTVPRFTLQIRTDDETWTGRFTSVLVSVNAIRELAGPAPVLADPKGGSLDVHFTSVESTMQLLSMAVMGIVGLWRSNPHLTVIPAHRATIGSKKSAMLASVDGELSRLRTPIEIACEPNRLSVLRP